MPAPIPQRTRTVYFLGAGFSRAFGLPNTAELLSEVHRLAESRNLTIGRKLTDAYTYFYPEEADTFIPNVVDFFCQCCAAYRRCLGKRRWGNTALSWRLQALPGD